MADSTVCRVLSDLSRAQSHSCISSIKGFHGWWKLCVGTADFYPLNLNMKQATGLLSSRVSKRSTQDNIFCPLMALFSCVVSSNCREPRNYGNEGTPSLNLLYPPKHMCCARGARSFHAIFRQERRLPRTSFSFHSCRIFVPQWRFICKLLMTLEWISLITHSSWTTLHLPFPAISFRPIRRMKGTRQREP